MKRQFLQRVLFDVSAKKKKSCVATFNTYLPPFLSSFLTAPISLSILPTTHSYLSVLFQTLPPSLSNAFPSSNTFLSSLQQFSILSFPIFFPFLPNLLSKHLWFSFSYVHPFSFTDKSEKQEVNLPSNKCSFPSIASTTESII